MKGRWRAATVGLALGALLLLAGCGMLWAGVATRRLSPPEFAIGRSDARLVGRLSAIPQCPQLVPCLMDQPTPTLRIYTIWWVASGPRGVSATELYRVMLDRPLGVRRS